MKCPHCGEEIEPKKELVWMRVNGKSQSIEKVEGLNKKVLRPTGGWYETKTGPRVIYVTDKP